MRLRATTGWAVTILLASTGCARVSETPDTGSGAGAAGTDGPASGLAFVQGGSRLVAIGYSSNDARLFQTFYDSQLGVDCTFVPNRAAPDEQHCVPSNQVEIVYTDSSCTEPAAWVEPYLLRGIVTTGDLVSGGRRDPPSACPGDGAPPREAFRVAERLSDEVFGTPVLPLFSQRDGRCVTASPPGKTTPPTYRLVPLPETAVVHAKRVSLDLGSGLHLARLIADDGAELNLGPTSADSTPCELQRDGECVPTPIARLSSGSGPYVAALNPDCTQPAFRLPYPTSCGTAQFGVNDDGLQPLTVWSMKRADAMFSWDVVLPVTDPLTFACQARSADDAIWMAAPDRDLTGTLPAASKVRRGTGPLHVDWFSVGNSDIRPVLDRFVDDSGEPCQVRPAEDGTQRCVPLDGNGQATAELTSFPAVSLGPI